MSPVAVIITYAALALGPLALVVGLSDDLAASLRMLARMLVPNYTLSGTNVVFVVLFIVVTSVWRQKPPVMNALSTTSVVLVALSGCEYTLRVRERPE